MASRSNTLVPFFNFDSKEGLDRAVSQANSHSTKNFVLDFNSSTADCAFDVDAEQVKLLLAEAKAPALSNAATPPTVPTPPSPPRRTRWIHVWRPEDQKEFVQAITRHYSLSTRLSLSMQSDPMRPQPVGGRSEKTTSRVREMLHHQAMKYTGRGDGEKADRGSKFSSELDLENRHVQDGDEVGSELDLNHYRIVNELWHFMSVDWGHHCNCFVDFSFILLTLILDTSIGYNALYNTKADAHADDAESDHARPKGTRIWWWIVVCDDGE